jgi:hypothetical protein
MTRIAPLISASCAVQLMKRTIQASPSRSSWSAGLTGPFTYRATSIFSRRTGHAALIGLLVASPPLAIRVK